MKYGEWVTIKLDVMIDEDNQLNIRGHFPGSEEWRPASLDWQQFDGETIHEGSRPVNTLRVNDINHMETENVLDDILNTMDYANYNDGDDQ